MRRVMPWCAVVLLVSFVVCAYAQTVDMKTLVGTLQQGGYVIVFRHGATNRDQADTDPLHPDNVAQQRLLSDKGREVARQVGDAFKTLGIPLGKVYTSKFNRAVETGKLVSGGDVTSTENDRRAEALKKMIGTVPEAGTNTLIVTHKPNIIDAFGKDWFEVKEGEASIFKPDSSGKAVFIARMQITDWIKAASGN